MRHAALCLVLWLGSVSCTRAEPSPQQAPVPVAQAAAAERAPKASTGVKRLRTEVLAEYPHDREAFTQGLVWHDGALYESTGLNGESSLRQVDLRSGEVLNRVDLDAALFGEGLARVGDELVQLTWQNGVARVYDRKTFALLREHRYRGEGWGLCFDGERLVMSDGSDRLTFRDPKSFEEVGGVAVTLNGRALAGLNELECVPASAGEAAGVYANVYTTDTLVRIDPASGRVTAHIDAGGLLAWSERRRVDVLNGIAYDPERRVFFLTGKLWPKLFEVVFVP